jgi:3-methylcrotonyl-CoA carboxylase alpha subunit
MFEKILIANRGEIACRVMRTAKRLGIRTVAVYSEADAAAMHVAMADEAYCIGPAPARESYLKGEAILAAAKKSGAQAIHPGYGFLSENADFALACAQAGVVFIGPPIEAIRVMGSKSESKRLMEKAGVPLVPGYHGKDQSDEAIAKAASGIGFPVLVKASAGGGGKGMRIVRAGSELAEAIAGARREAKASFGDDSLLVEKYLDRPRHVEIQVFADTKGNVVHLFERDCSLQRRHQKVIEEAPAPGLDPKMRACMGEAAVKAAAAVGYVGAGTVEFLKAGDHFYFIEMNTRLQVEHPVTEMITGQDLVAWQLAVASGQPLPLRQEQLAIQGHAFEARVYAEDPSKDFLPAIGKLKHLRPPREGAHVRVDTGVLEGDEVQAHYDPMIAKLICWDSDRASALRRLTSALADYQVVGVATNLAFLGAVAAHPAFAAGEVDTGFFERHQEALFPKPEPVSETVLALAALDVLLRRAEEVAQQAARSADRFSPWSTASGWRLNDDNHHDLTFKDGDRLIDVAVHYRPGGRWVLDLPSGPMPASCEREANGDLAAELGGQRLRATLVQHGSDTVIIVAGRAHRLTLHDRAALGGGQDSAGGSLVAPMPGRVTQVLVQAGGKVARGQTLLVIEAMKMEHSIRAPADGTVTAVNFAVGDQASDGDALIAFEAEEA